MDRAARIIGGWLVGCLLTGVVLVVANVPQADQTWNDQRLWLARVGCLLIIFGTVAFLAELYLLFKPRWEQWRNRPLLEFVGPRVQPKTFTTGGLEPVENDYVLLRVRNRASRPLADAEVVTAQVFVLDPKGAELLRWRGHWDNQRAHDSGDRLELAAGATADLDVLWKNPDRPTAYATSTEARHRSPSTWEDADSALSPGNYGIRVRVAGRNTSQIETRFDLTNPGGGSLRIGTAGAEITNPPAALAQVPVPVAVGDVPEVFAQPTSVDPTAPPPFLSPQAKVKGLVELALGRRVRNEGAIAAIAEANRDDADLYVDELARLPLDAAERLTKASPEATSALAVAMLDHLSTIDWGDRNYNYANVPLGWAFAVLKQLIRDGKYGLAEDLAARFFVVDKKWDRFKQHGITAEWLRSLEEPDGSIVAQALRRSGATDYYAAALEKGRIRSTSLAAEFGR